jgi:hypothetical protein
LTSILLSVLPSGIVAIFVIMGNFSSTLLLIGRNVLSLFSFFGRCPFDPTHIPYTPTWVSTDGFTSRKALR